MKSYEICIIWSIINNTDITWVLFMFNLYVIYVNIMVANSFSVSEMCRTEPASCRLCLSSDHVLTCSDSLDLRHDLSRAETLTQVLCLQWSLTCVSSDSPHHVCGQCHHIINQFERVQSLALKNEVILNKLSSVQFSVTKTETKNSDDEADDCEDSEYVPDLEDLDDDYEMAEADNNDNEAEVKTEESENCIKISFTKPESSVKPKAKKKARREYDEDGNEISRHARKRKTNITYEVNDGTRTIVKNTRELVIQAVEAKGIDINDLEALHSHLYNCPLCDKGGLKYKSLSKHIGGIHTERKYACDECTWVFKKSNDLKRHKESHLPPELCTICGGSFKRLKKHIAEAHTKDRLKCHVCDKEYISEYGLNYHIKTQHGENGGKEMCPYCAKEFSFLKFHIQYAHEGLKDIKKIKCRECDKTFRNESAEVRHYKAVHLNEKVECDICGGMFKNILNHKFQVHTGKHRLPCPQCDQRFTKPCDLRLHIERVHDHKRYACPECGKVVSKIREHLKVVHHITDINIGEIRVV